MDLATPQSGLTRSHGSLYDPNENPRDGGSPYVGFEQMWQNNNYHSEVFTPLLLFTQKTIGYVTRVLIVVVVSQRSYSSFDENTGRTWPDSLSDEDLAKLRPLLFLELSAMFDSAGIPFHKGKPHKRKRREGN